jgi:hypothetical protein
LQLDDSFGVLCVLVSLVGGFGLLLLAGVRASQKLASWATTSQAPLPPPGGFHVVLSKPPPLPVPVEPLTLSPLSIRTPLRFAVLHHTAIAEPHYDLLFEITPGSPLATWRSPTWPPAPAAHLTRLNDHRPAYLDYEGAVSDNRGHVSRVAGGTFIFQTCTPTTWELTLASGARLSLHLPAGATTWIAGYTPDHPTPTPGSER